MLSWNQLVGPGNRSWICGTHQRGSTLTGFTFSSPLIVVSYRGGGLGWFERREHESTCPVQCLSRPVSPRACQAASNTFNPGTPSSKSMASCRFWFPAAARAWQFFYHHVWYSHASTPVSSPIATRSKTLFDLTNPRTVRLRAGSTDDRRVLVLFRSSKPRLYLCANHDLFCFQTCRLPRSAFQYSFLHWRPSLSCVRRPLHSPVPSHLPDFDVPIEGLRAGIRSRPHTRGATSVTFKSVAGRNCGAMWTPRWRWT
jgi:hypothetical protein